MGDVRASTTQKASLWALFGGLSCRCDLAQIMGGNILASVRMSCTAARLALPILLLLAVVSDHVQFRYDQMILRGCVAAILRVVRNCAGYLDCLPHVGTKWNGPAAKVP